ncbi:MAG: response regulator [Desulfobulbaceae bacterium]|nr:response regulator [Desulfobulbaceae bacterium]
MPLNDSAPSTILTIEDDPLIRCAIATYMESAGYMVLQAENGEQGLECFWQNKPDMVMLDLKLPKVEGLEVLRQIHDNSPETPVIIVSGMGTFEDVIVALKRGAWDYVTKPINDMDLLKHAVDKALVQISLVHENKKYHQYLEKEIEKRTAELNQAQKLEAIGTLAGGIAHDFNNILGAIIGYAELSELVAGDNERLRDFLQQIKKAGNRASSLVHQILTFSRKSTTGHQSIHISPIVKEALKLLRASLPATIDIQQQIANGPEKIKADPTEIHQILINLCTNSFHAMKDEKGTLEVRLAPVVVDAEMAASSPDLQPDKYLQLTVGDSGCGMDETVLARIFDPFFTTKKQGKGTGLGLSVVHGIVQQNDGTILVRSRPGQGTTVDIYFPVTSEETTVEKTSTAPPPEGHERILLIDDEASLTELGKRMLSHLGYTVTTCNNSLEALERFRLEPDMYDLVITDQSMPNLPGSELIEQLRAIRPDLPVILCTGYSSILSEEKIQEIGVNEFMLKPLSMQNLAEKVRSALSSGDAPLSWA